MVQGVSAVAVLGREGELIGCVSNRDARVIATARRARSVVLRRRLLVGMLWFAHVAATSACAQAAAQPTSLSEAVRLAACDQADLSPEDARVSPDLGVRSSCFDDVSLSSCFRIDGEELITTRPGDKVAWKRMGKQQATKHRMLVHRGDSLFPLRQQKFSLFPV